MGSMDSLPLFHSWPLFDAAERLGLRAAPAAGSTILDSVRALASHQVGVWSCDLADNSLNWTGAVHRLFGLPEDEAVTRDFAASRYLPRSRVVMETLRSYAIEHRRGFTMDAMIRRADSEQRWMRLSAVPVISSGRVVRLTGTKQDVTAYYDGPGWQNV